MNAQNTALLTAGIFSIAALFGTTAAAAEHKGGLPYSIVERTSADNCVDKKIEQEVKKAFAKGQKEIVFKGKNLQDIKDKCVSETKTPLGIYNLIPEIGTFFSAP